MQLPVWHFIKGFAEVQQHYKLDCSTALFWSACAEWAVEQSTLQTQVNTDTRAKLKGISEVKWRSGIYAQEPSL